MHALGGGPLTPLQAGFDPMPIPQSTPLPIPYSAGATVLHHAYELEIHSSNSQKHVTLSDGRTSKSENVSFSPLRLISFLNWKETRKRKE